MPSETAQKAVEAALEETFMKAAVFAAPGKIEVKEVAKLVIDGKNQAIIRVVRASVCGSDLWWYRGIAKREANTLVGHEAIGVVEQVSADVSQIKAGDSVIVPFTHGCGHCVACLNGFEGNCLNQKPGSNGGYQAEFMKYEPADSGLVKILGAPADYTDEQLASLQTLSDVMATVFHAAKSADSSIEQAGQIARPGAVIGRVGVPHAERKSNQLFWKNIGLRGGIASVTKPDNELLLKAVLDGEINPGKVFTKSFDLDHTADAYAAMDQRQAIKSLLVID